MVTSIFNEIDFLGLEIAFLVCRHTSKDNWRVRWVHLNKVWRPDLLAIIIAHEGLLLVQIWGPEDLPIPRSRGGAYAPPIPTIDGSEVALRRVKGPGEESNRPTCLIECGCNSVVGRISVHLELYIFQRSHESGCSDFFLE